MDKINTVTLNKQFIKFIMQPQMIFYAFHLFGLKRDTFPPETERNDDRNVFLFVVFLFIHFFCLFFLFSVTTFIFHRPHILSHPSTFLVFLFCAS